MSLRKDLLKQRKASRKVIQRLESGKATSDDIMSASDTELKEAIYRRYPKDELLTEHFARLNREVN